MRRFSDKLCQARRAQFPSKMLSNKLFRKLMVVTSKYFVLTHKPNTLIGDKKVHIGGSTLKQSSSILYSINDMNFRLLIFDVHNR